MSAARGAQATPWLPRAAMPFGRDCALQPMLATLASPLMLSFSRHVTARRARGLQWHERPPDGPFTCRTGCVTVSAVGGSGAACTPGRAGCADMVRSSTRFTDETSAARDLVHRSALRVVRIGPRLDWRVTPYLWGASIEGDIALGPVARDVDVEFSDLLNVLSGAALLHVEAQSDNHIVFGDLVWLAMEPEEEIATIGGVAEAELDTTIIELGYARDSGWIRLRGRVALLGPRHRDRSGARRRHRARRQLDRRVRRLSQHARAWV